MTEHRIGTREDWQVARDELAFVHITASTIPADTATYTFDMTRVATATR